MWLYDVGILIGDQDDVLKENEREMKNARPLGVKLISALYIGKAIGIAAAVATAWSNPDSLPAAQRFASQLAPPLQMFHSNTGMMFAPLFVLLGLALGAGVWFLQGWAWGLLLVMCGIPLVRLAQFLGFSLLINHRLISLLPSSPFFAFDVFTSLLIVGYLLKPEVKYIFGDRD